MNEEFEARIENSMYPSVMLGRGHVEWGSVDPVRDQQKINTALSAVTPPASS